MRVKNVINRALRVAAILAVTTGLSLVAGPAVAAPYDPYTDTNPQTTGCAADAYTIGSRPVRSPQSLFGTMEVRYSPSCRTNWVRANISGTDRTINVVKTIIRPSSQPDGRGGWLGYYQQTETDRGAGSSFGMQVFAPGSTCIRAGATIYNSSNQRIAYTGTASDSRVDFC